MMTEGQITSFALWCLPVKPFRLGRCGKNYDNARFISNDRVELFVALLFKLTVVRNVQPLSTYSYTSSAVAMT